jgi:hypothetical protein
MALVAMATLHFARSLELELELVEVERLGERCVSERRRARFGSDA